ncbi:MAG: LPXTG cell wall anchor domain-containing protein [Oscillospiraceae bacterium]|nr:LPXTG cell wall anchor domain-containing protein [Oscillospiraceae bacterium]
METMGRKARNCRAAKAASFDDLIPLADVPATGDISIIWYGASLLSLAGLLVLSILGRKKTQED